MPFPSGVGTAEVDAKVLMSRCLHRREYDSGIGDHIALDELVDEAHLR
jgi:hypothetical protein